MSAFRSRLPNPSTAGPPFRIPWLGWISLLVVSIAAEASAGRDIYAFTVYCNAYPGTAGAINGSVTADKLMIDSIFTQFFSEQAWGVKLRKKTLEGPQATKTAILTDFKSFVEDISKEDTVFVHFSGHGVIPDPQRGEQFLQAVDGELFSRKQWAKAIDALPCRLKIFITDCCSSYPLGFQIAEGDEDVEPWKNLHSLFLGHTGFVNITAASPGQAAYGTRHGGFLTINLVSDIQRFRTWNQVFDSARERVVVESKYELERAGIAGGTPQRPFAHSLGNPDFDAVVPQLYVIPDSARREVGREELENLGLQQLYLARNEIFARHGYDFSSPFLRQYFGAQSWYRRQPGLKSPDLSKLESDNAGRILAVEKGKGGPFIAGKRPLPGDGGGRVPVPDLFAYSSERSLSRALLQNLTLQELSIARNEIYARHGYPFRSAVLRDYFGRKPDYRRNETSTDPDFNAVENHNLWLIRKIERIKGGAHKW